MTDTSIQWQRERSWLGYAGLVPVLACVLILALADDAAAVQLASDTLRYFAAVIASFLGAVHWGLATGREDELTQARLRWGVMPALIAWTLLLVPATYALYGFAGLFALILYVDCRFLPLLDVAYRELRVRLSAVVIASLLIAAMLQPVTGV